MAGSVSWTSDHSWEHWWRSLESSHSFSVWPWATPASPCLSFPANYSRKGCYPRGKRKHFVRASCTLVLNSCWWWLQYQILCGSNSFLWDPFFSLWWLWDRAVDSFGVGALCTCLLGATRAPCSPGFLEGRHVGLKGSTGYRMTDKIPYLHTLRQLVFFQRQALEKMNYANLFFSNHGL